jgi:hypothetical protein
MIVTSHHKQRTHDGGRCGLGLWHSLYGTMLIMWSAMTVDIQYEVCCRMGVSHCTALHSVTALPYTALTALQCPVVWCDSNAPLLCSALPPLLTSCPVPY